MVQVKDVAMKETGVSCVLLLTLATSGKQGAPKEDIPRPSVSYPHDRPETLRLPFPFMRFRFRCIPHFIQQVSFSSLYPHPQNGLDLNAPSRILLLYSSRMDSISSKPSGGGLVLFVRILGLKKKAIGSQWSDAVALALRGEKSRERTMIEVF